jgi:hypothetical protein
VVELQHFVITRFSYRGRTAFSSIEGPTFVSDADPLDPKRLELRFNLFEITCLPSVLAQTQQDFYWIILVDAELPRHFHQRLLSLVQGRPKTFIHAFDPRSSLAHLAWLEEHIDTRGQVLTTNLDDDDCISRHFIEALQQHLAERAAGSRLPPIGIIGAKSALEWDLVPSAMAPLGWKAPWHRGQWVMSVGLSLHCKVPEFDLCVLGLRHRSADHYLDFNNPPVNGNAAWFQRAVIQAAHANGVDLRNWQAPAAFFHDISQEAGAVLLTNHDSNDQATRVRERKPGRERITGPESLPQFAIDWQKAAVFASQLPQAQDH